MSASSTEPPTDPDALRRDIAELRTELGDTVEALAAKADVKAQAKKKVDAGKQKLAAVSSDAKEKARAAGPIPPAAIGVAVAAVVTFFVWRRFSK